MGLSLVDSGGHPVFCSWGAVGFQPARGRWIIVRVRDGALATSFRMGKADIHIFSRLDDAVAFLTRYQAKDRRRGLNGRACLVQLSWQSYVCRPPLKAGELFVEHPHGIRGFRAFQCQPPKTWRWDRPGAYLPR